MSVLTAEETALAVDALNATAARYTLQAEQHYQGRTPQDRERGKEWARRYAQRAEAVIAKLQGK